jgi:hypothetical protein
MDVCVCSVCVFSVSAVSSETASRPNKRFNEDLSLDKPLHVIYKVSKLAYRISVILIANERVKKNSHHLPRSKEGKSKVKLSL